MYVVYAIVLFLGLLIYAPLYLWKGKKGERTRLYLRARLGLRLNTRKSNQPCLWFHAVSVGEVLSLRNLLQEIGKRHPDWEIHCSTLTSAGLMVAGEKLAGAKSIFYSPIDFRLVVDRFFRALRPDLFILVESEFWPNLIRVARKRARALLVINGRISSRSFRRYQWAKPLVRRILWQLDRFLVQTELDRWRLVRLGLPGERIEVVGNLKCDVQLPVLSAAEKEELQRQIGLEEGERVIVAGSTHPGEEEVLLESFSKSRQKRKSLKLILAPRHAGRAPEVERLAQGMGLEVERRSCTGPGKRWDVLVLDTMGELGQFYSLSDLAFVGGSLVPRGGQNLLEPAFYGKPIIFGPHMDNFAFLAEEFLRRGAARLVLRPKELTALFLGEEEKALQEMGNRARAVLQSLQGATERTLCVIESFMADNQPAPGRT